MSRDLQAKAEPTAGLRGAGPALAACVLALAAVVLLSKQAGEAPAAQARAGATHLCLIVERDPPSRLL